MSDKNLIINDLLHRYPGYSFVEAETNDVWTVSFIDGSSDEQSAANGLTLIDAFRKVRADMLKGADPEYLSTTTQRDALTNIDIGQDIDNITIGRLERYTDDGWKPTGRRSNVTGITASTTQTQGQGVLTGDLNVISTVANSMDVITLPTAEAGLTCIVLNSGAKMIQIYPNTGDDLGAGLNTATSLKKDSVIVFYCYDDTYWLSFGDSSSSETVEGYGAMYEDNSSGSDISVSTSYVGWKTATEGAVDGTVVIYTEHTLEDRLTVYTAGTYRIAFSASVTNDGGKLTTAAIHVDDVEQTSIKTAMMGDSSKAVILTSSGILTLTASNYISLKFKSESSDTVSVYQANVNISLIEAS